jgi:hypothetical protein
MLSLLFVPAFFTVMDDFGQFIWRISRRFVTSSEPAPAHKPPASHSA